MTPRMTFHMVFCLTSFGKRMDRILIIILPLKNNPETIEIKYPEDLCRLLRLDEVALTLVCRQTGNCAFSVTRKKRNEKERGEI